MYNEENVFTLEEIEITTISLLEDVLNDKIKGISFAIDPSFTDTNFWLDPYFKFYPDSFNRDKATIEYRIYFTRAAWTVHSDSEGKTCPRTMNRGYRDLLMNGLLTPRLPGEKQLKKKHKDLDNPKLISTYEALCEHFDFIARSSNITDAVKLSGRYMPNYLNIEFEEHS